MNTRQLIAATAGLGLATVAVCAYLTTSAWADPLEDVQEDLVETDDAAIYDEPAPYPGRLKCKAFPHPLDGTEVELPGTQSAAGQWVKSSESGWQIYTAELVVGQKATGFPQGWLHVCLRPL